MIVPQAVNEPPAAAIATGNWAGYGWYGNDVSAVQFKVPNFPYKDMNAAEKANHTAMTIWTGLYNYPYIEQLGIYDYVSGGAVHWAGFCAFWPTTNVSCGEGIAAGDEIFASVHRNGLTYTMSMHDAGPHNKWTVTSIRKLSHEDTTATAIIEDSQYPGYPIVPLSYFAPETVVTSPSPSTEYFSPWGAAKKLGRTAISIFHR